MVILVEPEIGEIIVDEEVEIDGIELDVVKEKVVTSNYDELNNLPQINDVELVGNKTAKDLMLQETMTALTNLELEKIFGDL